MKLVPEPASAGEAVISLQRDLETIAGMQGGSDVQIQVVLDEKPVVVRGRRCRLCGHGELSDRDLEAYAVARVVRDDLTRSLACDGADTLLAGVLTGTLPDTDHAAGTMREALVRRDIALAGTGGDTCPCCDGSEVVDYCWKLSADGQLEPGLALREAV